MLRLTILVISCILASAAAVPVRAQTELSALLEQYVEHGEEIDADVLVDLVDHPLDLNRATADELLVIPALTAEAAREVIRVRMRRGGFTAWDELLDVPGITEYELTWLSLLTEIRQPRFDEEGTDRRPARGFLRSRAAQRLDTGRGYDGTDGPPAYVGGPMRHYQRARIHAHQMEASLTLDKHPGELYEWDPRQGRFGFEFISFYLQRVAPRSRIPQVIVGDFVAGFGQGLALGAGGFGSKSRETVRGIGRRGTGIRGTGSTTRSRYLRGIAFTLAPLDRVRLSVLMSRRYRDASSDTIATEGTDIVRARSVSASSLRRTETERARRSALRESVVGGAVEMRFGSGAVGVTAHSVVFDPPIRPPDRPDLAHVSEGSRRRTVSAHGHATFGSVSVFAEIAHDGNSIPWIAGASIGAGGDVEATVIHREYPPTLDNHIASSFGHQRSNLRNESGTYLGLRVKLSPSLLFRAYIDDVRFPWLRFGHHTPSTSTDWLVDLEYRPRRWWQTYVMLRGRSEEAPFAGAGAGLVPHMGFYRRSTMRMHNRAAVSSQWTIQVRADMVRVDDPAGVPARGMMLYQDLRFQPRPAVSISGRFMIFDTDGPARIYAYESDLTGAFGLVSVSGRGRRVYALATWQRSRRISLQAKYGMTHYLDVETVGSGYDEVDGRRLRDIRIQLDLRI